MIYLATTFDNNRRIIPNKSIVLQVRTGTILKNTVWTLNVGYACTIKHAGVHHNCYRYLHLTLCMERFLERKQVEVKLTEMCLYRDRKEN